MLNGLDLFSGIGGITLALDGYVRPVAYCECDLYCISVLLEKMRSEGLPRAPICTDVRELRGEDCGEIDIIYGGFPCQDISTAGKGAGLGGERSGLFFEIVRLTKEIKPSFVFLENVPAIRTRGLREVIRAFTEVGYDCRWTCISASSVGANHKRERWFLLAHSQGLRDQRELRGVFSRDAKKNRPKVEIKNEANKPAGASKHASVLADSKRKRLEGSERAKSRSCWTLRSIKNWEIEPNVGRVVDGLPFRMERIKSLGNSVVPLQVRAAFERLIGIKPERILNAEGEG